MSTDPTTNTSSGLTGDNTTTTTGNNGQEGIVPTVLSYVGLGGNGNTTSEQAPATADDRGAAVGVGASAVAASSAAGAAVQQGHGPAAAAAGAAVAAGAAGAAAYGGSKAGANDAAAEDGHLHPHDEDSARSVAARATGGVSSGYGDGSGLEGNTGVGAEKVRDTTGVGAVNDGSYASGGRSTSGIGSGVGVGSDDAYANSRSASGVGSGAGVNDSIGRDNPGMHSSDASTRDSSAGLAGTTVQDETRKTERADDGTATGSEAQESQATTESRNNNQTQGGGSRGKMENKDAIPIAGGVKLGEKHWGESEIIPDNPKPRSDEGVSSSEGQPDR